MIIEDKIQTIKIYYKKNNDNDFEIENEFNELISDDENILHKKNQLKIKKELFNNEIFGDKFLFIYFNHRINIKKANSSHEKSYIEIILEPDNSSIFLSAIIKIPQIKNRTNLSHIEYYIKDINVSKTIINIRYDINHILNYIFNEFSKIIQKHNVGIDTEKKIVFILRDKKQFKKILTKF